MEAPGYLVKKSIVNGIQNGRAGLGSVFVFASGNGGRNGDQCNFDGYTNSIYSITVASLDYKGLHPDYSEACAANMVVAYSSGSGNHIVSSYVLSHCSRLIASSDNHRRRKEQVRSHPRWYICRCAKCRWNLRACAECSVGYILHFVFEYC